LGSGESDQPFVTAPWVSTSELGEGGPGVLCCYPSLEFFKSGIAGIVLGFMTCFALGRAACDATVENQIQRDIGFSFFVPVAGITVAPSAAMVTSEPSACIEMGFRPSVPGGTTPR